MYITLSFLVGLHLVMHSLCKVLTVFVMHILINQMCGHCSLSVADSGILRRLCNNNVFCESLVIHFQISNKGTCSPWNEWSRELSFSVKYSPRYKWPAELSFPGMLGISSLGNEQSDNTVSVLVGNVARLQYPINYRPTVHCDWLFTLCCRLEQCYM